MMYVVLYLYIALFNDVCCMFIYVVYMVVYLLYCFV